MLSLCKHTKRIYTNNERVCVCVLWWIVEVHTHCVDRSSHEATMYSTYALAFTCLLNGGTMFYVLCGRECAHCLDVVLNIFKIIMVCVTGW